MQVIVLRFFIPTITLSSVLLVQDNQSQRKSVLKLFDSYVYRSRARAEAEMELSLQHPRILKVYNFFPSVSLQKKSAKPKINSHDTTRLPAIELEYAPHGHLLVLIKTLGALPTKVARTYFHQLIEALEYIHTHEICHLDIKPENILLDENFGLKIADFGAAAKLPQSKKLLLRFGTKPYFAPEILEHRYYDGVQADLFAAGIILFMLRSGYYPFLAADRDDMLYKNIANGEHAKYWELLKIINEDEHIEYEAEFKDLMNKMFEVDPKKRLRLKEIKYHPWYCRSILSTEELKSYVKKALIRKGKKA